MESVLTTVRPQHRRCVFVRLVVARTMITIPVTASTVMGHYGTVSDFLVVYLDSIDERLLEYLDEDDELKLDAVKRLSFYTSALLDGSINPDHVMEDWPDWYRTGISSSPPSWPPTAPMSCRSWKPQRSFLKRSRYRTT